MPRAYMAMYLVVKSGKTALMLGDQDRGKAAVAVSRDVQAQWALIGKHCLAAPAISKQQSNCAEFDVGH